MELTASAKLNSIKNTTNHTALCASTTTAIFEATTLLEFHSLTALDFGYSVVTNLTKFVHAKI
jgi:hypothetical protein